MNRRQRADFINRQLQNVTDRTIKVKSGDVWLQCPFHNEKTPSLTINFEDANKPVGIFYCFSANTKVITYNGVKKIKDIVNKNVYVMDGDTKWVKTKFKSYGKDYLYKISLIRDNKKKTVYASGNHRWFVKYNNKEKLTTELKKGTYLIGKVPSLNKNLTPKNEGIRHGFTFGDGTLVKSSYTGKALYSRTVFGNEYKREIISYYKDYPKYDYDYSLLSDRGKIEWKELPNKNISEEYALGFIMGYFASDGCVGKGNKGQPTISSKYRYNLVRVKNIALSLGIMTYPIKIQYRKGYNNFDTPLYSMAFQKVSLNKDFFINPFHKENFVNNPGDPNKARVSWKILDVEKTSRFEEVYCCEVPTTNSFLLSGFLLTGNCFGCKEHGDWNKLAEALELKKLDKDKQYEDEPYYTVGKEDEKELGLIDEDDADDGSNVANFIDWNKKDSWRGITGKLLFDIGAKLRYSDKADDLNLWLPVYVMGERMGSIDCVINVEYKGQNKYFNSPGKWTRYALFPYDYLVNNYHLNYVVLVEGPRDALNLIQYGVPAMSLLGSYWSKDKRDLILNIDPDLVVLALDPDTAGRKNQKVIYNSLKHVAYMVKKEFKGNKDPADLTRSECRKIHRRSMKMVRRLKKSNSDSSSSNKIQKRPVG